MCMPYLRCMAQTIIGVFANRADADGAIDDLRHAGYHPQDISIVMRDNEEVRKTTVASPPGEGVATGATTGAIIGGIAGLLIGIGAIAIPGIGAVLIGGPIAAALGATGAAVTTISGAATGAVAGGIIGLLGGLGVPEEEARGYEERIRQGAILVAVSAQDDSVRVKNILEDNNAEKIRVLNT